MSASNQNSNEAPETIDLATIEELHRRNLDRIREIQARQERERGIIDRATIDQLHRRNLDRIREIQARQEREEQEIQAINDERNRAILEEDANIPKVVVEKI